MASVEHVRRIEAEHLTIEVGPEAETCMLRLVGELDIETTPALESELNRLSVSQAKTVVVDLGGLTFIDSMGLSCLVKAARLSSADGNRLRMLAGNERVVEIMKLAGVDKVLPLIG